MSKYEKLWQYLTNRREDEIIMSFDEVRKVLGFDIDHSFLNYKNELVYYGFDVKKVSLKDRKVIFVRNSKGRM